MMIIMSESAGFEFVTFFGLGCFRYEDLETQNPPHIHTPKTNKQTHYHLRAIGIIVIIFCVFSQNLTLDDYSSVGV